MFFYILTMMPFVFKREFRRMLVIFALGLSVCLVQVDGASTNNEKLYSYYYLLYYNPYAR